MNRDEWPTWARFAGRMGIVLLVAVAAAILGVAFGVVALAEAWI